MALFRTQLACHAESRKLADPLRKRSGRQVNLLEGRLSALPMDSIDLLILTGLQRAHMLPATFSSGEEL
jgi:hypothetical protein